MDTKPKTYYIIKTAIEKGYFINDAGEVVSKLGCIRKEYHMRNGYNQFNIYHDKKAKGVATHVLAAAIKFGLDAICNGLQVRHMDGNKQNNRLSNINIGTPQENQLDIPAVIRSARSAKSHVTRKQKILKGAVNG